MGAIPSLISQTEQAEKKLKPIFGVELYVNPLHTEAFTGEESREKFLKDLSPEELNDFKVSSHILAIAITRSFEWEWQGQSNRLYRRVCFFVTKASNSSINRTLSLSAELRNLSISKRDLLVCLAKPRSFKTFILSFFLKNSSKKVAEDVGLTLLPVIFSFKIVYTKFGFVKDIALM
jgi:hypothetical protein